jgi:beta-galactosidase
VEFRVLVDGQPRATARVTEGDPAAELRLDGLAGARRLELQVTDGGDDDAGDRAAWVDGVVICGET